MSARRSTRRALAAAAALVVAATGCGTFPKDSEGTLDRVRGGTLVVGVSEHEPWTSVGPGDEVSGTEVALVEGFAESLGAEIEWEVGPESILADEVKRGQVDIVIGGLTSVSPWKSDISLTRPYTKVKSEDGKQQKMVMGVPKGENAFQVALERYLAEQEGEIR